MAGGSAVGGCGVQRTLGARRHGPSRLGRRQRRRARHPLRTCADDALASLIEPAHSSMRRIQNVSGGDRAAEKVTYQTHRPGECSWSVSVNDAFQTREEGFAARAKEGTEGRKGADPRGRLSLALRACPPPHHLRAIAILALLRSCGPPASQTTISQNMPLGNWLDPHAAISSGAVQYPHQRFVGMELQDVMPREKR